MNALSKASGSLVRPRPVFSLSSWFYAPDLDMKEFEILNRASAFIVPAKCPTYRKNMFKYHIVTVSHAVAPWRWPKYYAEEWLKGVNESHCHYTIELRREDGMFMTQDNLIPHTFHHPFRDLSVLHIDDEDSFSETIEVILQTNPVQNLFSVDAEDLPSGQEVEFVGHEVKDVKSKGSFVVADTNIDERAPFPLSVGGKLDINTAQQHFARSHTILTQGMCGGPLLVTSKDEASRREKSLIYGMVDGIVPPDFADPRMRGLVSYITRQQINEFLTEIEANKVSPENVLIGGESLELVQTGEQVDPVEILRKFEEVPAANELRKLRRQTHEKFSKKSGTKTIFWEDVKK